MPLGHLSLSSLLSKIAMFLPGLSSFLHHLSASSSLSPSIHSAKQLSLSLFNHLLNALWWFPHLENAIQISLSLILVQAAILGPFSVLSQANPERWLAMLPTSTSLCPTQAVLSVWAFSTFHKLAKSKSFCSLKHANLKDFRKLSWSLHLCPPTLYK